MERRAMRSFEPSFPTAVLLLCLSSISLPAMAVTRTWPGAAPCNTTLQACINGAIDGDRIEIATDTPISESPAFNTRSLELVAANGYRPRLSDNNNLSISSASTSANQTVLIDGIRLRNGYIVATYTGTGTGNYTIRNMQLEAGASGSGGFINSSVYNGTLNLALYNNDVHCSPGITRPEVVGIFSGGGTTLNANVYDNKVACSTQDGVVFNGVLASIGSNDAGVADATLKLHGNEIRAERYSGSGTMWSQLSAISVREGINAQAASTIKARIYNNVLVGNDLDSSSYGILAWVQFGDMDFQAVNNTITGWKTALRASTDFAPGTGPQAIHGSIVNNLMVANETAFDLQSMTTASLSNNYNLVNAPLAGTTLGSSSITAPAKLVSNSMPRLRADSPAIGAADTATLLAGVIVNGLPGTDADGLRRIKGAGSLADIGAYEFGDMSFEHRVTGSGSNNSRFYSPALDGIASAIPQASVLYVPGSGVVYDQPYGLYYAANAWRVFDEAQVALSPGTAFSVFAPASGGGQLRHVATPASITSYFTQVDNSNLNNKPDLIVLATQNWDPNFVYNPHPVTISFGIGYWYVSNVDHSAMTSNAAFNLYWQTGSPNAFRVTASTSNLSIAGLRVDHPLLDGNSCARPQATRITGAAAVANGWQWFYAAGSWNLFSPDGIPVGTQFNVVVDPAQVALCSDRIFANDF